MAVRYCWIRTFSTGSQPTLFGCGGRRGHGFSENGKEIEDACMDALAERVDGIVRTTRLGNSQFLSAIDRLSRADADAYAELIEKLYDIRGELREVLLPQQLGALIGTALRTEGIRAIRYEEVSLRCELEEGQVIELTQRITDAQVKYVREISPGLRSGVASMPPEERKLLRENGIDLSIKRTEEELQAAADKRDREVLAAFREVLDED